MKSINGLQLRRVAVRIWSALRYSWQTGAMAVWPDLSRSALVPMPRDAFPPRWHFSRDGTSTPMLGAAGWGGNWSKQLRAGHSNAAISRLQAILNWRTRLASRRIPLWATRRSYDRSAFESSFVKRANVSFSNRALMSRRGSRTVVAPRPPSSRILKRIRRKFFGMIGTPDRLGRHVVVHRLALPTTPGRLGIDV